MKLRGYEVKRDKQSFLIAERARQTEQIPRYGGNAPLERDTWPAPAMTFGYEAVRI